MKTFLLVVLVLGASITASAQTGASTPEIEIRKVEWHSIHGPWPDLPGPISDGSGIRSTSAGGAIAAGSPPMSSAGNGQYYVSDNVSLSDNGSKPSRARYQRIVIGQKAVLILKNNSAKNIGRIYLDFIFEDPATRMELLRYHFRANKEIAPGRVSKLKQDTYLRSKNASRFSPHPSGVLLERTNDLSPKVVVTRIEYTDGSIWER